MYRILIAPNSFKGCANSVEIARIISDTFHSILHPKTNEEFIIDVLPVSDGGDGFLEICRYYFQTEKIIFKISSPTGLEEFSTEVGINYERKTAYIESAKVLGLLTIPDKMRDIKKLSSIGMGELLKSLDEFNRQNNLPLNEVIIGIGGTGTNDLGMGMAGQFGLSIQNSLGENIKIIPVNYSQVFRIDFRKYDFSFLIKCVVDVLNPLTGEMGATRIFGKQKGASNDDIDFLENGFLHILSKLKNKIINFDKLSGAGGGLAAGLQMFCDAEIIPASEFLEKYIFKEFIGNQYDLVITGEGVFDSQSMLNKAPKIILDHFGKNADSVAIICGKCDLEKTFFAPKIKVFETMKYFSSTKESIENVNFALVKLTTEIIEEYFSPAT